MNSEPATRLTRSAYFGLGRVLARSIVYRGADTVVVWPLFMAVTAMGAILFSLSLGRFRKALGSMA